MLRIVDGILERRDKRRINNSSESKKKDFGMPTLGNSDKMNDMKYLNEVLFEAIQGGLDTTTAVIEWTIGWSFDSFFMYILKI